MWKIRFKGRILRSSSDPQNSMPILAAACPFLFPVLPPSSTWKKTQEVGKDYDSFGQGIIASQEFKGAGLEGWQAPGGISPSSWTLCPWGGVRPEKDHCAQDRSTGQDSTWSDLSVTQTGGLEAACGFLITFFSSFAHLCPTLQPHGLQHARLPCPSPTLRACPNSCLSSRWTIRPSDPLSFPSPPAFNLSQH